MKRLENDPDLLQRHDKTIKAQVEKGVFEKEKATEINNANKKHYIPHHTVINPENTTTTLRIG